MWKVPRASLEKGAHAPVVLQWSQGPPGFTGAGRLRGVVSGESGANALSAGDASSLTSSAVMSAASMAASAAFACSTERERGGGSGVSVCAHHGRGDAILLNSH